MTSECDLIERHVDESAGLRKPDEPRHITARTGLTCLVTCAGQNSDRFTFPSYHSPHVVRILLGFAHLWNKFSDLISIDDFKA